jgi:MGT family glycosyltransferase
MRFLFNVWARTGHLYPSIGLAQRLIEIDHEVAFFCFDDAPGIQARFHRAGMNVECLGPPESDELARLRSPSLSRLELTRKMRNSAWRLKYFDQLVVHRVRVELPHIREAIRKFRPDVICNEGFSYGGAVAAELEGIPWASIAPNLDFNASWESYQCDFRDTVLGLDPARRELAKSLGATLDFRWFCAVSPFLNLAFSIPELTPEASVLPSRSHLVGPARDLQRGDEVAFPWEWLEPSRPLVYISDGTELKFAPEVSAQLARAAVAAGAQVVIADGDLGEERASDSGHILRVRYAPQLQLLRRSALFITHGGANSLLEGIMSGVPMLFLPIGYDQAFNASCAKHAGIARVQDPWNLDAEGCARDIRELVQPDAKEARRMKELQAAVQDRDGCRTGAALLCDLALQGEMKNGRSADRKVRG